MRYLPATLNREETRRQIESFVRHWEERGYGLWAVEAKAGGEFIGFVGLAYQHDWPASEDKVEVGWRLDKSYWGRGFATEGAVTSLRYGFERLDLPRIISICDPRNAASRRVMEKSGLLFQGMALWRGYEDVWYAVSRESWMAEWASG